VDYLYLLIVEVGVDLQGVIFDLDGTLVDSRNADLGALSQALEQITGERIPLEQLSRFFGVASEDAAEELVGDRAGELLDRWSHLYHATLADSIQVFPGIKDVLRELHGSGMHLGVVTLQTREEMEKTRQVILLDEWIDVWVALDDTLQPKPSPEPVMLAIDRLALHPEHSVMIGDSMKDMRAGRAAGIRTGAALWGSIEVEELLAFHPDYIFHQPVDLRTLWNHRMKR
jgi:pyrophosphatase PpaX